MLYRTLKRMIVNGQIEGLLEKIEVFYSANKLTEVEYDELINLLN